MTIYYCDHGVYDTDCVVIGNIPNGSSVLTVTSVVSGTIGTGGIITLDSGTGSLAVSPTWVERPSSSIGLTGNYILSNLLGTSNPPSSGTYRITGNQFAITPMWGVPQDGDGLAKDKSTAVATAKIKFSAVPTVGTSPNITILGIPMTTLTTLTGAASADAAANALAVMINSGTYGLTSVPSTISNTTPRLCELVWARGPSTGAAPGTCEIMTRVGSALLNYSANTACQITTVNVNNISSTAADQQFSGGISGCYGCFVSSSSSSIGPRPITNSLGYGLWGSTQRSIGGVPGAGDIVYIRSNKVINNYTSPAGSMFMQSSATRDLPLLFIFDDGTIWTSEAGINPIFEIRLNIQGSATTGLSAYDINGTTSSTFAAIVRAKKYTTGPNAGLNSFQINLMSASAGNNGTAFALPSSSPTIRFENMTVDLSAGPQKPGLKIGAGGNYSQGDNQFCTYIGCVFKHSGTTSFVYGINTNGFSALYENCTFSNKNATLANLGILELINVSCLNMFNSCTFEEFQLGSRLIQGQGVNTQGGETSQVIFRDCDLGNITNRGPVSLNYKTTYRHNSFQSVITSSCRGFQEFSYDTKMGFLEWNAQRQQPTLNATCRDGFTKMSWRFIPAIGSTGNVANIILPFETPRLMKINTLGQIKAKFTVEMLLEETLSWNKRDIFMVVEYDCAQTGKREYLDSLDLTNGPLDVSTADWRVNGTPSVQFNDGGLLNHNKYSFNCTTPVGRDLAANGDIVVSFRISGRTTSATKGGFIDPYISVVGV